MRNYHREKTENLFCHFYIKAEISMIFVIYHQKEFYILMPSIFPKDQIYTLSKTAINTIILFVLLKNLIKGEKLIKIITLALSIAIPSVHAYQTLYGQYLGAQIQFKNHLYFFFMFATQFYLLYISTISLILGKVKIIIGQQVNSNIKKIINRIPLYLSLIYLVVIVIYFFFIFEIGKIFLIKNFILVCFILIGSFSLLVMVSIIVNRLVQSEVIRRKIFHIGPILVIPIISYYNHSLLRIILAPSFFILFLLEVIRYEFFCSFSIVKQKIQPKMQNSSQQSKSQITISTEKNKISSQTSKIQHLNPFEKLIVSIFSWMGSMNKRQKGFWFTHLFLTVSLLCAYQFQLIFSSRLKLNGHVVLILLGADGIAAVIGSKFGRIRLYSKKTLQGSLAFFIICFTFSKLIIPLNIFQIALISFCATLAELYSGDLDNITTLFTFYLIRYILVLIVKIRHS